MDNKAKSFSLYNAPVGFGMQLYANDRFSTEDSYLALGVKNRQVKISFNLKQENVNTNNFYATKYLRKGKAISGDVSSMEFYYPQERRG